MTSSIIDNIRRNVNHWYLPIIVGLFFIVAGIYIFIGHSGKSAPEIPTKYTS